MNDNEIFSTRILNAPAEKVFNAFKDPRQLALWWGPKGFANTFSVFEFKEGGDWKFIMHGPDGRDYKNESEFVKIIEPSQIIFDHISAPKFRMEIGIEAQGDKTRFSFHMIFPSAKECTPIKVYAVPANEENFDRLEALLKKNTSASKDNEIVSTRIFNASIEKVFDAFKDPQQLAQWWGPKGFTNTFEIFEFKEGGHWKFVMHAPDGNDYENESKFIKISEPSVIVYDHFGHVYTGEFTLEDLNGKTKLSFRMIFPTVKECEEIKAFVIPANEENFDKLETLLK